MLQKSFEDERTEVNLFKDEIGLLYYNKGYAIYLIHYKFSFTFIYC